MGLWGWYKIASINKEIDLYALFMVPICVIGGVITFYMALDSVPSGRFKCIEHILWRAK